MKKKIFISLTIIYLIIIFSFSSAAKTESNYNWEQLIKTTQFQLKENKDDIFLNYTMAVAYANVGEIKKTYNIINVFGSSVSREDFNTAISPYLVEWENYNNHDNLLLLNYAAFREVINKNYKEAVSLFEYIFEIDSNNFWALNHAAAALIEVPNYELALKYADQALVMQENEYSHLIKGYVYYEKGDYLKVLIEAAKSRSLVKALAEEEYQDFTKSE